MKHLFAFAVFAVLAAHAAAQQHPPRPNAANPDAVVPPVRYESAFAGYAPYREQDPGSWRELNDEVARIGGHIRMFGGAGHGGAKPGPAKPAPVQPAANKERPDGERSAPQAPQTGHKSQ